MISICNICGGDLSYPTSHDLGCNCYPIKQVKEKETASMTPQQRAKMEEVMQSLFMYGYLDKLTKDESEKICEHCFVAAIEMQNEQIAQLQQELNDYRTLISATNKSLAASQEREKVLREALKRLSKCGPPSRSCSGSEIFQVMLEDNCRIASEALAQTEESKHG